MSTTNDAARKPDENVVKDREVAAKKATPLVSAILTSHRPVKLADLVQAVALDAAEKGMTELPDPEILKLGGPVVKTALLSGYTPARYGDGAWLSKAAGKAIRAAFDAAKA
jgi:hypothetical protein